MTRLVEVTWGERLIASCWKMRSAIITWWLYRAHWERAIVAGLAIVAIVLAAFGAGLWILQRSWW